MNRRIRNKKDKQLGNKIDKMTSKLSSNPTIKTPQQLDKWFRENGD